MLNTSKSLICPNFNLPTVPWRVSYDHVSFKERQLIQVSPEVITQLSHYLTLHLSSQDVSLLPSMFVACQETEAVAAPFKMWHSQENDTPSVFREKKAKTSDTIYKLGEYINLQIVKFGWRCLVIDHIEVSSWKTNDNGNQEQQTHCERLEIPLAMWELSKYATEKHCLV